MIRLRLLIILNAGVLGASLTLSWPAAAQQSPADRQDTAPAYAHPAYCAVEITDSSLREGTGPVSQSKAGRVFCGDALSHGPANVGKALAESIVVEFKNRQRAR